jgi:outer membrane receptor protein involved in Fe transport
MLKKAFIAFCFFSAIFKIYSQAPAGNFYGIVVPVIDSLSKKPISLAAVEVKNAGTGKLTEGGLTDSTGKTFIRLTAAGFYEVVVTAVGYSTKSAGIFRISDSMPVIKINPVSLTLHTLDVVRINVDAPIIENKVDRLVYNASQDISSKGGTATDLFRKVPMVEVDPDGNISIRGSQNIRVLINGKPSAMMAGNIRDAIRAIPADQIERIEVITNPSARYDAEGTAGLINIVLKESKIKGVTGGGHSGFGNRSGNLGFRVAVNQGKTSYNFRLGGYFWRNVGAGMMNRYNDVDSLTYHLRQSSDNNTIGGGPFAGFGIDHEINKKNSLSFSGTLRGNFNLNKSSWKAESGINELPLNYLYSRSTDNVNFNLGYDFGLDYRRLYNKKQRELSVSALWSGTSQRTDYTSSEKNNTETETYREKSLNDGFNREMTIQLDFIEPIGKKNIFETGIKAINRHVTSDYHFDSLDISKNEFQSIQSRNNNFYYDQNVAGGYVQNTFQVNKDYSVRTGLRYEYTTYGGGRLDSNSTFTGQPYGSLIPFVNINRRIGFAGFARFSYTRRIQRPGMFYLNPYTNFSDPRNISTGNPYLRAELGNNFELSAGKYGKKGGGSVSAYARSVNNAIETVRFVDSNGVYNTTYGNVGENLTTGADINVNFKGKQYMINFNGGLGYVQIGSNQSSGTTAGLKTTGLTYSAGLWGNYKFLKNWTVEAFARFNAPAFSLQGRATSWYFHTVGVKRRFKNDKGGIGIGVDNPFTPRVYYTTSQKGTDFTFTDRKEINMLGVRVNLDYRFGKIETEMPQKKATKGVKNDDVKQGEGGGQNGGT